MFFTLPLILVSFVLTGKRKVHELEVAGVTGVIDHRRDLLIKYIDRVVSLYKSGFLRGITPAREPCEYLQAEIARLSGSTEVPGYFTEYLTNFVPESAFVEVSNYDEAAALFKPARVPYRAVIVKQRDSTVRIEQIWRFMKRSFLVTNMTSSTSGRFPSDYWDTFFSSWKSYSRAKVRNENKPQHIACFPIKLVNDIDFYSIDSPVLCDLLESFADEYKPIFESGMQFKSISAEYGSKPLVPKAGFYINESLSPSDIGFVFKLVVLHQLLQSNTRGPFHVIFEINRVHRKPKTSSVVPSIDDSDSTGLADSNDGDGGSDSAGPVLCGSDSVGPVLGGSDSVGPVLSGSDSVCTSFRISVVQPNDSSGGAAYFSPTSMSTGQSSTITSGGSLSVSRVGLFRRFSDLSPSKVIDDRIISVIRRFIFAENDTSSGPSFTSVLDLNAYRFSDDVAHTRYNLMSATIPQDESKLRPTRLHRSIRELEAALGSLDSRVNEHYLLYAADSFEAADIFTNGFCPQISPVYGLSLWFHDTLSSALSRISGAPAGCYLIIAKVQLGSVSSTSTNVHTALLEHYESLSYPAFISTGEVGFEGSEFAVANVDQVLPVFFVELTPEISAYLSSRRAQPGFATKP
jgi:hypothetical protein